MFPNLEVSDAIFQFFALAMYLKLNRRRCNPEFPRTYAGVSWK
jgi:hypothetical protein